jgi:hypothetical protein
MSRLLVRHDETDGSNPCLCGILVVLEEDFGYEYHDERF